MQPSPWWSVLNTAKFQMLFSRSENHTKYQLWLFWYMAYFFFALLSAKMANEYMLNCSANQQGDIENNIPSVEILVQTMKKCVWARCKCYVPECPKGRTNNLKQDEIKENIQKECKKNRSWKRDLRHINQLIFHLWLDNFNV